MREFRFSGVNVIGEPVRGTVFAPSEKAAWKRIRALSEQHEFQPQEIEQRYTYLYKVRHPNGRIVKGEQKAYSPDEVRIALERLGLEVLRVEKKVIDLQFRPSTGDLVMFVRLAANMLRRQLPFDEVLNLLAADTRSKALRQIIRDLSSDLKSGMDAQQAFMKHQHLLGRFTAFMLGLAASSGNMAAMFEATAKYLERKNEFRKQVRSALITPTLTFIAALAAFVWFVWDLIPEMMTLFSQFEIEIPPFTAFSLGLAAFMDAHYWWLLPTVIGFSVGGLLFAQTTRGRFWVHKQMLRIPVLGDLLHKLNLEVFCRVFGVLYTGSTENHEIMRIAAEATGNTYIEHQVKTITVPLMMARGTDLIEAMEAAGVFLPMTLARFRSGAETGSVRESAEEMAEFYEKETTLKLTTTVEAIKTGVAVYIAILVTFLTIVSTETALMMPSASSVMDMGL
ncbi:type II secretion system protein [Rhodothermaceae bacterium RA]|nr:type II secretion system protein [Rhodothermaceae bacterium RA]